ncbi:MAG TPA: SOS response-associated peptidase [Polyangiales bacterium]|nr:SOS response-associated peptidase [Polyangiales bacterium]
MCGRYTLTCPDQDALIRSLPFDEFSETRIRFRPRYNIAPGQSSPVVYLDRGKPVLADARWGFEGSRGATVITARSETAARTTSFRDAFQDGRCLVPADGFFEWRKEGRINQPYLFRRADGGVFVMAGLWQNGRYVVLTCDAREEVADIHDRMPVVLESDTARDWLTDGTLALPPELTREPVSVRVNRIENDDPACLAPLAQSAFDFD